MDSNLFFDLLGCPIQELQLSTIHSCGCLSRNLKENVLRSLNSVLQGWWCPRERCKDTKSPTKTGDNPVASNFLNSMLP